MDENYYVTLGIRPNASSAEIELAMKGKRAQYHPDRYASMDAETIAWATSCMQKVNEAYRVLATPDLRQAYDTHHGRGRSGPVDVGHGLRERPCIVDYLANIDLDRDDARRFHLTPNIPAKKAAVALSNRHFTQSKPPSEVYLLIDDTVFLGGSDGLLITDEYLSFKSMFTDSTDFQYGGAGGWRGGLSAHNGTIRRMDRVCVTFSLFSVVGVQKLVWNLNRYFSDRLHWHENMARSGCIESQFFLSGSYEDNDSSIAWLTKAAEGGHMVAQHNLGVCLMHRDLAIAYEWLVMAAQQGSTLSKKLLESEKFARFRSI